MADSLHRAATELATVIPEVWSKKWYPTLLAELPFNDLIDKSYEGEIAALGDTVNINNWPEFDQGTELAEDAVADAEAVTPTQQQLVINKQVVKDFIITDVGMVQSLEAQTVLRDLANYSIMKKMQSDIITATVPSSSSPDHQIAYDSGTTLALADILEGKELLDGANVPKPMRKMVVDAPQENDLFNITGFVSRDFIPAGSPVQSGEFSTPLLGFETKTTTEASNVTYLLHPSYLTMAVQKALEVKVYDLGGQGKRAMRINTTILYGVKQLGNTRVVEIS